MDMNALKLLVEIVDAGSLSGAARRLNTTRSNVSHRLKAFEQTIGVQLLRRTTRRIEPTQVGYALYEHGAKMVQEMEAAREVVATQGTKQRGHVRISVPAALGQMVLGPLLIRFAQQYPEISLNVVFSNRIHDLVAAEVDIALRITSDPPEAYVAHEIAAVAWTLCASPAYLKAHGTPRRASQLAQHQLVSTPEQGSRQGGRYRMRLRARGKEHEIAVPARLQSENFLFLKEALLARIGIGLLPSYVVQQEIDDGRLATVLPDHAVDTVGDKLYMITAPNRYPTMAARTLMEFLKESVLR